MSVKIWPAATLLLVGYTAGAGILSDAYVLIRNGPFDGARTLVASRSGDTPILKQNLFNYVSEAVEQKVRKEGAIQDSAEATVRLHQALNLYNPEVDDSFFPTEIDPQKIPMSVLWDASEEYAKNSPDSFFGPKF